MNVFPGYTMNTKNRINMESSFQIVKVGNKEKSGNRIINRHSKALAKIDNRDHLITRHE